MAWIHGDIDGYYETLRLPAGADLTKVEKAYATLEAEWRDSQSVPRFQIQEAYRCLRDPQLKADYDARSQVQARSQVSQKRLVSLSSVMFGLFLVVGYVFPGYLLSGAQTFHSGDVLFQSLNQLRLGSIVRREPQHVFPNGQTNDAYLVRELDATERWYPAGDLERHFTAGDPPPKSE